MQLLWNSVKESLTNSYCEEVWGSALEMTCPIVKMTYWQSQVEELKAPSNRFAHVTLAQLALTRKKSPEARLSTKFELTVNWDAQPKILDPYISF